MRSSSSPCPPAPCPHSRTAAWTLSPGSAGQTFIDTSHPSSSTHTCMHVGTRPTHRGRTVGRQLLQKWEGRPLNGLHGPAAHRQVAGLPRVQHAVPHAHLAPPPGVLRAARSTCGQGLSTPLLLARRTKPTGVHLKA